MQVYEYVYTRRRVAEIPATINSPDDVYVAVGKTLMAGGERESLVVLNLDTKHHIIGVSKVYAGNVSASIVRIGELFRDAVRLNASAIVLIHNHPSGDTTPSPDDIHLTEEAISAGRLLDIGVLDHLIMSDLGYMSLRDMGIGFERRVSTI